MKTLLASLITAITARIRLLPLLRLLQAGQSHRPIRRATRFFDPNYIRQFRPFGHAPKYAMLNWRGTRLRVNVNDHIGFQSFVRNEPFEMTLYAVAQSLDLGEDDVVLDIGANIGTASVPLCRAFGCELAAVEASKDTASELLKNIAMNGVKAHVDVVALSDQTGGFLTLHLQDGNRGASSLLGDWGAPGVTGRSEMVPVRRLDDYIAASPFRDRIKLIKIDVEGAELSVIQGGRDFLAQNTAPILMEYRIDAGETTRAMLFKVLRELDEGYIVYAVDQGGTKHAFDRHMPYENILFERRMPVSDTLR